MTSQVKRSAQTWIQETSNSELIRTAFPFPSGSGTTTLQHLQRNDSSIRFADANSPKIHPMQIKIIGARPYPEVREDCHAVKAFNGPLEPVLKRCAERIVDAMTPEKCILVPVPGHYGTATHTCALAWAVALEFNRRHRPSGGFACLCDILECDPHMSLCEAKHAGIDPDEIELRIRVMDDPVTRMIKQTEVPVYLVDNVVDTGRTVRECLRVLPASGVLAIGDTGVSGFDHNLPTT